MAMKSVMKKKKPIQINWSSLNYEVIFFIKKIPAEDYMKREINFEKK